MTSLIGAIRKALDTFIQAVETRMDLFALELHEEKIRVVHIVLWTCAAVFLSALTLIMITLSVVLTVNPEHQKATVIVFSIVYLAAAIFCIRKLYKAVYLAAKPFAETVAQLKQDRQRFSTSLNS